MKKITVLFVLILSLLSCSNFFIKNSATFHIMNSSQYTVTSVEIGLTPEDDIRTISQIINPGESKDIVLDMSSAKSEGCYTICYYLDDKFIEEETGYYSNGCPSEEELNLVITSEGLIKW